MPGKLKPIISETIAAMLIFLFLYTAVSKIIDHDQFLYVLKKSSLLAPFSPALSWIIPVTEILISILLFSPKLRKNGLLYAGLLIGVFALYILYMIVFIPHLPCSCGGVLQSMSWRQHLVFNTSFMLLAFYAWSLLKTNKEFVATNGQKPARLLGYHLKKQKL